MRTNFGEEHRNATGNEITVGGYPDMGSGRYSSKLTYEQWYKFNNAQRVHYNFIEFAPSMFVVLLIAGVYFPVAAAVLGLVHFVGRIIYSIGYANGGPHWQVYRSHFERSQPAGPAWTVVRLGEHAGNGKTCIMIKLILL